MFRLFLKGNRLLKNGLYGQGEITLPMNINSSTRRAGHRTQHFFTPSRKA